MRTSLVIPAVVAAIGVGFVAGRAPSAATVDEHVHDVGTSVSAAESQQLPGIPVLEREYDRSAAARVRARTAILTL